MTTSWQMKWLHQAWGFFVMLGEAAALDVLCHVCLRGKEHNGNKARQSQNAWVRHVSSLADYPHKCIHTTNSLCLIHTHTICTKSFHNYKASWLMVWQSLGSKYTAPSWKHLHVNFASITSSCLYLIDTFAEVFSNEVIQSLIVFLSLASMNTNQ